MNKTEKSFWNEVKNACQKREANFEETKKWINSMIENLGEHMLAYYVSDVTPTVQPNILVDIVILTTDRVYGFTINKNGTDYHVHLVKNFGTLWEEIRENLVMVKFFELGMQEGFFIADKIERLHDTREFTKKFAEIAWR